MLVKVRQGVSAHVSPECYYEQKVIEGPVSEIGWQAGQAIIMVGIPEGTAPPYVHSSGRIYRRVGDESDPKSETDRYVLEQMWHKGDHTREQLRKFIMNTPPGFSQDGILARSYIYFLHDPSFAGEHLGLRAKQFREIMCVSKLRAHFSVKLENVFSTVDGLIARQVEDNNPASELMSFRWWTNGNIRLTVPITAVTASTRRRDPLWPSFEEFLRKPSLASHRALVADFTKRIAALTALTDKYYEIRELLNLKGRFYSKIRFTDTLRLTPYLNMKRYIDQVSAYGLPVIQDEEMLVPMGNSNDTFWPIDDPNVDLELRSMTASFPLVFQALGALGVQLMLKDLDDSKEVSEVIGELFNASLQTCGVSPLPSKN